MNYRETLFKPRGFLIVGGAVLLLLGVLGFFILNDPANWFFWLDPGENIAHWRSGWSPSQRSSFPD